MGVKPTYKELEKRVRELEEESKRLKLAEEALRESEERHRSIFENSLDGIMLLCPDGRILAANPEACRMHGCTETEICRLGRSGIVDGGDAGLKEALDERSRTGRFRGEVTHIRKDGTKFPCEVSSALFRNKNGRDSAVVIIRDITGRKHADEVLRDSKVRLELALDSAEIGIHEWNILTKEMIWDDRIYEFWGLNPGSPVNYEVFINGVYPEDRAAVQAAIRPLYEAGDEGGYRIQFRMKGIRNGIERWLEVSGWMINEEGRPRRLVGTAIDITERKQAEKAIRESETRFKLLSCTASALLKAEHPRQIIGEICREIMNHLDCQVFLNFLVDEGAPRLRLYASWGFTSEDALKIEALGYGQGICGSVARGGLPLIAEDIQGSLNPQMDLLRALGMNAFACQPLVAQDRIIGTLSFGTTRRPRFSTEEILLMKTVSDQVAAALERKRLIEELQRSREELEIRVERRTAELERNNNVLLSLNKELQEFAFVASHDLQEPLRKIQLFGEMVVGKFKNSLDEKGIDYLDRMQDAAKRMQTLLTALLDYSRVATRADPFSSVDLNEVAKEAISNVDFWIRQENGRVEIEDLPVLETDRSQMVRLFQNLLSNGLKYHKPNEAPLVRVYSAKGAKDESGETWLIKFQDNGIGFEEKYREQIFKPFERLHGKSSPYTGVGMGLAICKKIVERHGGTITAESTPANGSAFIVTLPMRQKTNGD